MGRRSEVGGGETSSIETLLVAVGGAIAGTVIGGLLLRIIWGVLPSGRPLLRKLWYRAWTVVCFPVYRWLGLLSETPTHRPEAHWASSDQFNGVQEGEFVTVRATVHSKVSDWEGDGIQYGWRLDISVGADRIVCFFPNGYKKSNRRYLRRLRGSQHVVVRGKVTSLSGINSIYKNGWLKPTMNICDVVGAWKAVDRRQWLRVAGWREAQLVLERSSSSLSRWSRLGQWIGRLR